MSWWRHTYHLIWATWSRSPFLLPTLQPDLYAFLATKLLENDCQPFAVNGMEDHVHVVLSIPPKIAVATVAKRIKGASSRYLNLKYPAAQGKFAWQEGYGSLTVGKSHRSFAVAYVEQQKEHHQRHSTNQWLEYAGESEESGDVRERPAPYFSDPWPF
jgi:putative transposase